MKLVPTISTRVLLNLLDAAEEFGTSAEAVCAAAGTTPQSARDPEARIPLESLHAAWETITQSTARTDAPVILAQRYTPSDYELLGFICMNSKTIEEGLVHLARYSGLWMDEPVVEVLLGARVRVSYKTPLPDRPGKHRTLESALAKILHAVRAASEPSLAPSAVRFSHPPPADLAPYRAFFQSDVIFQAPANELQFEDSQFQRANNRSDPRLVEYLRNLADEALARRANPHEFVEQLRQSLFEEIPKGLPSLERLARRLGMSERTLRRRLNEKGTSFTDVLDGARQDLARRLLSDRRYPLAEVAFLLGFSEQSAFHRAFKRWTGTTPAAYRTAPS